MKTPRDGGRLGARQAPATATPHGAALAKQLHAKVHVAGKSQGTEVQIVHTQTGG